MTKLSDIQQLDLEERAEILKLAETGIPPEEILKIVLEMFRERHIAIIRDLLS